jgi:hypothetical protein
MSKIVLVTLLGFFSVMAQASQASSSCYHSKLPAQNTTPQTELFIVVDQTTLLDDGLKQSVANQIRPFLVAGNRISVVVFSAYTQGRYTQVLASSQLDHTLSAAVRNSVSKPVLEKFDQCMNRQPGLVAQLIGATLRQGFEGISTEIAKSDIYASLKDISGLVRQSSSSERVVLLVSDMLENSSITSFYANNSVRKIDPAQELQLAEKNQLLADFSDARIYVIGAGLLPKSHAKNKSQYRDPKTMQALSFFLEGIFSKIKCQVDGVWSPCTAHSD